MTRHPFDDTDQGFSLVENIVSLLILAIVMIMSITSIGRTFATIAEAERVEGASAVAAAELEAIRALDFGDVGTENGVVRGAVTSTKTVTLADGDEVEVDVGIEWVGSGTGLDIVPGGGDGVPGFYDPGINYKLVEVTATPDGGDPMSFQTFIAPPDESAATLSSNVSVNLYADEPPWSSAATEFPTVYLHHPVLMFVGPVGKPIVLFSELEADAVHSVSLGIDPDDAVSADGRFALTDAGIDVTPSVALTTTVSATFYRPVTLEIVGLDGAGLPLTTATLNVRDDDTGSQLTLSEADMTAPGVWTITEMDGAPLKWGTFTYTLSAPDHITGAPLSVDAPADYPTSMTDTTTIQLTGAVTSTATVTVTDQNGLPLTGVDVTVENAAGATVSLPTEPHGLATFSLVHGQTYDIVVSSPYGHDEYRYDGLTPAVVDPTAVGVAVNATLATPAGSALLTIEDDPDEAAFTGHFEYQRAVDSGEGWLQVEPNASGDASIVVTAYPEDLLDRWEVRAVCPLGDDDDELGVVQFNPLVDATYQFDKPCS